MTFPVRWFFWLPAFLFGSLALCLGASAGHAVGLGDFARAFAVSGAAMLFVFGSAACALVASEKTI